MQLAKRLDGIGEYYFSQKLREIDVLNKQGKNVISLGIGSPDLPPHADVIKLLQDESIKSNVHAYQSYRGTPVLRKAMSDWYREWYDVSLNPDSEVLPLIGSKEGIMHICMTYFENGMGVLLPNPGYPTYSSAVKLSGATPVYYNLSEANNYEPDFEVLQSLIHTSPLRISGMFVNYPHMPTGKLPNTDLFERIVGFARANNILVVHDNPYSFLLPGWRGGQRPVSLLQMEGSKDVAVELNSLSKSHNMAGWRVGMLCGAKERIDEVLMFKSNMDSGMFLPLQLAAARALILDGTWYENLNDIYNERRKRVFTLLDALQCNYSTSQAGLFVWAPINKRFKDCYHFSDAILQKASVFITPGGIFGSGGEQYIRVSLCADSSKIDEAKNRIINANI